MIKIYSKIENNKLLHMVNRLSEITSRTDIIPDDNFLQLATLKLPSGKTFRAHKHKWKDNLNTQNIAQESWVVIKGSVKCFFYDLDDKLIQTEILNPGDCSITLSGGHNYEILEEETVVYEYKTGPYQGVELDKEFLSE
jgi:hypothetical protein